MKVDAGRFAFSALALFLLWIVFTSTLFWQELLAGAVFSVIIAALVYKNFTVKGLENLSPKRVGYMIVYIPFFLWEIIKANLDVAYRVINPKMPINPGIVEIRTNLKSDIAKLGLANSITLTPGTLTMDIDNDRLFIHWINVKKTDVDESSKEIASSFEKYLRVIFE